MGIATLPNGKNVRYVTDKHKEIYDLPVRIARLSEMHWPLPVPMIIPGQAVFVIRVFHNGMRIETFQFDLFQELHKIPFVSKVGLFPVAIDVAPNYQPNGNWFHYTIIRRKLWSMSQTEFLVFLKSFHQNNKYYNALLHHNFIRNRFFSYLTHTEYPEHERPVFDFVLQINLTSFGELMDKTGNRLMLKLVNERIELDDTLSWLSTLGGAFSALGDISSSWAEEAGKVTVQQLKLAIKLDDPFVISRCHLYAALSLMQRGFLKSAWKIVKKEYKMAKLPPNNRDPRLLNMCFGVYAKLRYLWCIQNVKETKQPDIRNSIIMAGGGDGKMDIG